MRLLRAPQQQPPRLYKQDPACEDSSTPVSTCTSPESCRVEAVGAGRLLLPHQETAYFPHNSPHNRLVSSGIANCV